MALRGIPDRFHGRRSPLRQNIRKSSGFEITDKIKVALSKNPQTDDAVNEYNTYICNQVLANSLELVDEVKNGTELNFDDFSLYVSVVKE